MTPEEILAQLMGRPLVSDPFPLYEQLRRLAPVHRESNGVWYLLRYRDCESLLRSSRFGHHGHHGAGEPSEGSDRHALLSRMFSFDDPPAHTRKRAVFAAPFTATACEAYIPVIDELVADIVGSIGQGVTELVVDTVAARLPVEVTCRILGIPRADQAQCVAWVEAMTSVNQPVPLHELEHHANLAARGAVAYFTELLAERTRNPEDDLLSHVARTAARDASLTDEDLVANIVMLMAAGFETTRYTIAGGIKALLEAPDQLEVARRQIAANGRLSDVAVEELLRYCGPIHAALGRRSTRDEQFGDVVVPAGEPVVALVAGANRDPDAYPEPNRLDLERSGPRPLAFGHGPHYCLGAFLAKHEINLALSGLVVTFPHMRSVVSSGVKGSFNVRGVTDVVVAVS